ncbi:MAG: YicC family protein [Chlorobi bacterium]|nr:YicC family protein [Chlorobiota bacterium]
MIFSMTGYGKATCEFPQKKINIEIRSLNSKQLDINARIPGLYREKEIEIRNMISNRLFRGKVDISFFVEAETPDKVTKINTSIIESYYEQLKPVAEKLNINNSVDYLRIIMPLPDTTKTEQTELDPKEWTELKKAIEKAIDDIVEFRKQEGLSLENEITQRIKNISNLLKEVEPLEKERIEKIKERLNDGLQLLNDKSNIDENRFEQELIYYLEKLDITEEKVRLANHLSYFLETIKTDKPVGKKLGFITQEIGREINTLGSKANDANLQRIVIKMKDELEKIKEQILNVL